MRRWRVPAAGGLLGLLIVAVYFVALHRPRGAEIDALQTEAERFRSQQAPLQRQIAAMEEVAGRKAEFDAALHRLEQFIPPGLAQPTLLAQLQAAADAASVELVSVGFEDPAVPEGAPESPVPGTVLVAMPLTAVVEGPYAAVTEMLRRVEADLDRAVLVGTVALTEADDGFPRLTATWSGQVYALLAADDPLVAGSQTGEAAASGGKASGEPSAPAPATGKQ